MTSFNCSDARLLFPTPTPMVFVGKNIDSRNKPNPWYFQETDSFCSKSPYVDSRDINRKKDNARLYVIDNNQLYQLVDCGGLP